MKVRVTEKQCFGSAGCNVTFAIEPSYAGPITPDPSTDLTVTYEVSGGEDGPSIRSFKVEGDKLRFQETGNMSTSGPNAEITATVTDVF